MNKNVLNKILVSFFVYFSTTSCSLYKMPDENSFRTIPTTNNPQVIKEAANNSMPAVDY